ncbi:unnamed protein product [Gongylonema pulchrum]|uniref:RRM domain-containing protein n=1 Tax=Gongylonema pulchrum TaxID=637853 RepID=A0A183EPE9_9BILA|nr:unnamed protein product [Gongylonema pulchrum]
MVYRGPLAYSWVLVCSVPDKTIVPELRDFAIWLTGVLQEQAASHGFTHYFDEEPKRVLYTTPGNEVEVRCAYSTIHRELPGVMVVFHILPEPDSLEYKLMKELAAKYDLIRQGILLTNAVSRFAGCRMRDVVGNILQWFSRCLSRLILASDLYPAKFTMKVGNGPRGITIIPPGSADATYAVNKVLHGKDDEKIRCSNAVSLVHVYGFPNNYSKEQLVKLFGKLRITNVTMNMDPGAVVEFANKFHAAQAVLQYNQMRIGPFFRLSVLPLHPELKENVAVALRRDKIAAEKSQKCRNESAVENGHPENVAIALRRDKLAAEKSQKCRNENAVENGHPVFVQNGQPTVENGPMLHAKCRNYWLVEEARPTRNNGKLHFG